MNSITQQQRKWTAIGLIFISLVIVVVGIRTTNKHLRSSFILARGGVSADSLVIDQQASVNERLRSLDTDDDGINDFEELYLYTTSPYLSDSDSDGFSDYEEIASGDDPNCPGSEDCYNAILTPLESTQVPQNQLTPFSSADIPPEVAAELRIVLPENPTANDVRALLIEQGVSAAELSQISDQELLTIYQQAYNEL